MKLSAIFSKKVREAHARLADWPEGLPGKLRLKLLNAPALRAQTKWSYLDAYHRIRETTPLIQAAIARFDAEGDTKAMAFWADHHHEEFGHDQIMRADLARIFGGEAPLRRALASRPISPPSAALVGFFHWQVRSGNPHLLMAFRFFLEQAANEGSTTAARRRLGKRNTRTLALHSELDREHIRDCAAYLDRRFRRADLPTLEWCADFIGSSLADSQRWIALRELAR